MSVISNHCYIHFLKSSGILTDACFFVVVVVLAVLVLFCFYLTCILSCVVLSSEFVSSFGDGMSRSED